MCLISPTPMLRDTGIFGVAESPSNLPRNQDIAKLAAACLNTNATACIESLVFRGRSSSADGDERFICQHESFICQHESLICQHESCICQHESFICQHESFIYQQESSYMPTRELHLPTRALRRNARQVESNKTRKTGKQLPVALHRFSGPFA